MKSAAADAARHGFNPLDHYWTATINGRTMHFRPGKPAIDLPADEKPKN